MSLSAETILTDIYDAWRAHNLDLLATYLPDDFSHFINVPTEGSEFNDHVENGVWLPEGYFTALPACERRTQ